MKFHMKNVTSQACVRDPLSQALISLLKDLIRSSEMMKTHGQTMNHSMKRTNFYRNPSAHINSDVVHAVTF